MLISDKNLLDPTSLGGHVMRDGLFRSCDLPAYWQKACRTLVNAAMSDGFRRVEVFGALRKDCSISPEFLSACKAANLFQDEVYEQLAHLPKSTDFEREVLRYLRFGYESLENAIGLALESHIDAICRKAEGEKFEDAREIREKFAWIKQEIALDGVVHQLCSEGKIKPVQADSFDLDAHIR